MLQANTPLQLNQSEVFILAKIMTLSAPQQAPEPSSLSPFSNPILLPLFHPGLFTVQCCLSKHSAAGLGQQRASIWEGRVGRSLAGWIYTFSSTPGSTAGAACTEDLPTGSQWRTTMGVLCCHSIHVFCNTVWIRKTAWLGWQSWLSCRAVGMK